MDPRSTEKVLERDPYTPRIEEYRLARVFGWDYWQIRLTPLQWRKDMLDCYREDERIQSEMLRDLAKERGQGAAPGRRGRQAESRGAEQSIPMREWTPELFKNAKVVM